MVLCEIGRVINFKILKQVKITQRNQHSAILFMEELMQNFEYKHIIWDWNGTLLDDSWLCLRIINDILRKRNMPKISPENYQKIFGFPLIEYYNKLGFDFSIEPFSKISTEFIVKYEKHRAECKLRAGALKILKNIHKRGISQSIISASKQTYLDEDIDRFNIRNMFMSVIGLDDHYAFSKVDIAKAWISKINIDLHKIALIGDTIHDYEVAETIGVDCYLIPSGHQNYQRLEICNANMIESFDDLHNS